MLLVVSKSDNIVNYNGYQFYLGSIGSSEIPEYPAVFPVDMEVSVGDYLDEIEMDLTTCPKDGKYIDCIRVRKARVSKRGILDRFISLSVYGIVLKPKTDATECPRVGMDSKPYMRFTLKSKDAFNKCISRPAFARKAAPAIFALENRTFVQAEVSIMPDMKHGFILHVRAFQQTGGK